MERFGRRKKSPWNFFLVVLLPSKRAEGNCDFYCLASWRIKIPSSPILWPWHNPSQVLLQSGDLALSFLLTQPDLLSFQLSDRWMHILSFLIYYFNYVPISILHSISYFVCPLLKHTYYQIQFSLMPIFPLEKFCLC